MKVSGKIKISCLAIATWIFSDAFPQKPKESNSIPSEKEITVCHLTNDYKTESLRIPYSSLSMHLEHGDFIGECSSGNSPIKLILNKTDVQCHGGDNGAIDLDIQFSSGNHTFNILWSNGAVTEDISSLRAGVYSVTVSLGNGISATASITIDEPAPLLIDFRSKNISCSGRNDGEISITAEGGVPPYFFSWSQNAGVQSGNNAVSLAAGVYRATVIDAVGCISIADIAIEEPAPLTSTFSSGNVLCSGGNNGYANVVPEGGVLPYSFVWGSNAGYQTGGTATNLSAGIYSCSVTDANGCLASAEITVEKDNCDCTLRNEDCGATVVSLAQFIYCNPVSDATNYQWEFIHKPSGFLKTIQRGSSLNNFHLTWIPGIQYGKTYDVRIKPLVNGIWNDYGPVCQVTVPGPIPDTKVREADCGRSTTSLNQQLFCDFVAGAQNYQWEFSNADLGFQQIINRGSSSLSFILGWVPGIQYGKTYNVRVKANVGGDWGEFGDICQVSLVYPIPTTKVRFADCGITLLSLTQNIFCDGVAGATDYQWEISNTEFNFLAVFTRNSTNTNFQLGWIAGIQFQAVYDVRVRAKVAGEWAEFGFVCQITAPKIPGTLKEGNFDSGDETFSKTPEPEHQLSIFPNPSKGETISISLSGFENTESPVSVDVYDILGNKVFSRNSITAGRNNLLAEINSHGELATGIYILNVSAKNKNYYDRIVIK